jgi:hypothetical protein
MKKEIIAGLVVYYGKQETEDNKNNPILAELLKSEIELNEHVLHTTI